MNAALVRAVAGQQVLVLRRQRLFLVVLSILLLMTALAGVIGFSSQQTVSRVYQVAVGLLTSEGKPVPANPVGLKPTLSLLSNMSIYVPLIGALMALVLGHLSLADDESSGIGRLIFSRGISRPTYLAGRVVGAAAVLAVISAASLALSGASLVVVNAQLPSPAEIGRLVAFYALSWLYMMMFALVGMITVLVSRRRSMALLSALAVWLVVTFALPQFTSGLRPVASLNPVTPPVSASASFFQLTAHLRPVSLSEQYKAAAAEVLQTAPGVSATTLAGQVLPLLIALAAAVAVAAALVRRHDYSRSGVDE